MIDASPPTPAPSTGRRIRLLAATALVLAAAACGTVADDASVPPPPVVEADPEPDTTSDPPGSPADEDEADTSDAGGDTSAAEPERPPEPDLSVSLSLPEVARLGSPVAGDVGPDGVLYFADRAGTVHPFTAEGIGEAVVDLSDETTTESERGLLGIAFAADGTELYLSSTDRDGASTVTAVAVEDGQVRGDDRRTVFRQPQPYANHNGGDVHIGPDGLLYLGLGDGGSAGDPLGAGQDLSTPLGALLRIDPQRGDAYAVPSSNPFVDLDGAALEVFAYGLRNPWRFSFDPVTDELWIGDVGQDAREEINRIGIDEAAGANFGWNLMEGTTSFAGSPPSDHVSPVYEYQTGGPEGCAVTGGVVYRGSAIPELTGVYLYADACNGSVRGLLVDADGTVVEQAELGVDGGQVVAFVPDADGEVYVLDLGGSIRRLAPA